MYSIQNNNNNINSCVELNDEMKLKLCGTYFVLVDGWFNITLNSYCSFGKKRIMHRIMKMKLFIKIQINTIAAKGEATLIIFNSLGNVFLAVSDYDCFLDCIACQATKFCL